MEHHIHHHKDKHVHHHVHHHKEAPIPKNVSYEDMPKHPPIMHEMSNEEVRGNNVPMQNAYERSKSNSEGYNQSGT